MLNFFPTNLSSCNITISSEPCYEVPDCAKEKAFVATLLFQRLSFDKFYLNENNSAYAKVGTLSDCPVRAPHSVRKLDESSFLLTLDRKQIRTLAGRGSFKVVKKGWLITLLSKNHISMKPMVCATDIRSQSEKFSPHPFESLPINLLGIEHLQKKTHRTSKGLFKQFHISNKALCSGEHLAKLSKPPNFNQILSIFCDLTKGIINLFNHGLIHGDLKPSNLLIYRENRSYTAKLCDLNSAKPFHQKMQEQTWDYLGPSYKMIVMDEFLKRNHLLDTNKLIQFYETHLNELPLTLTYESTLQSLGLVFIKILLDSKTSRGSPEKMAQFWELFGELTGIISNIDFASSTEFNSSLLESLMPLIRVGIRLRSPPISFEKVLEKLASLKEPTEFDLIPLSQLHEIPYPVFFKIEGPYEEKDRLSFQSLFAQIYKLFLLQNGKKVYFSDSFAYTKNMNSSIETPLPHFFRHLNETQFLVMFERKSPFSLVSKGVTYKEKYGWHLTCLRLNEFVAKKIVIYTDLLQPLDRKKPWSILSVHHLTCVSPITIRHPFLTSGNILKHFHLINGEPITALKFVKRKDPITFAQFSKICTEILVGMSELHENGLVYGNFKPSKIHIFKNQETGVYSAKINPSETCVEIGSFSFVSAFDCFSPRIRRLIRETISTEISDPTYEQIKSTYYLKSKSFGIKITPEDETATTAIVLSVLANLKKEIFRTAKEGQPEAFWRIIRNLSGGYLEEPRQRNVGEFYKEIHYRIDAISPSGIPNPPRISLRDASALMQELYSSSS